MNTISEELFCYILQQKLGKAWERALKLFQNYGEHLSFDVTNVLLHAAEQGKVDEVLQILEKHFQEHLSFQHPDVRGCVYDLLFGVNPTEAMFLRICHDTLGFQRHAA